MTTTLNDSANATQADDVALLRASFLEQMRQVPGSVAIIACASGADRGGLVATAWTSLCADPPMLLACVNQSASAHGLFEQTGAFSVNLLAASDTETVAIFSAKRDLGGSDRFLDGEWSAGPLGQPLLNRAVVAFECKLDARHVHGTHSVLIGRVGHMSAQAGAEPLLFVNGSFARAIRH